MNGFFSGGSGAPDLFTKIGDVLWLILGIGALALVIGAKFLNEPTLQEWSSSLLILGGTIQILLGVRLSQRRKRFLEKLVRDEKAQPTVYVREVMQTRALINLLQKLKNVDPTLGVNFWQQEVDKIISVYQAKEAVQASKVKKRHVLSQKRLAMGLLSASYNTFWGSAMVVVGTIMAK